MSEKKRLNIPSKKFSKLLEPVALGKNLKDLSSLDKDLSKYIIGKLDEQLHSQLIATIGPVSPLMARLVKQMVKEIDYQEEKESDLLTLIVGKILSKLKKHINKSLVKEAEEIERRISNVSTAKIKDVLHLDIPLGQNPIFDSDIRQVKTIEYTKLGNLDEETSKKLVERNNLFFDDTDEAILSGLVKEGVINEEQKQNLLLISSLSRLTGDNIAFMKALKTQELRSTANFVNWEIEDWQDIIKTETIQPPLDETVETYSGNILFNIKRTYPSQFLINRLINQNGATRKINLLDSLNVLLENNDMLMDGKSPANMDWRGIGAEKRKVMQEDLQQLSIFANSYHRLGLVSLINNRELDLAEKKQAINSRLQSLKKFFENNSELDLRYANLFDTKEGNINWHDIDPIDKPLIRKQVMAYQRILNIAKDPEDSMMLLSKGYDSVMAISEKSESGFIHTSGLDRGKARLIYAKSQKYSEVVAHNFETIRDALKGQFKDIRMANISTKLLANELQEIDGFADLFGSQNFCGCEECMSLLSPAAYFVDLMRFIDANVSQQVFVPPNEHHPLKLSERRKDLWELELTCENTHTLIPYLTIVNEVLERYVTSIIPQQQPDNKDVYEKFSENSLLTKVSFSLPFNLPMEELRTYLDHFSLSLHDIYKILKLQEQKVWRARMDLSKEEFTVITTQENPIDGMKFRFGDPASFTGFPLQDFIRFAGISREQLDQLLSIKFNPDLRNIEIGRQEQDPSADDLMQNFEEILNHLSFERLDFIHRFIRLLKKTPWTILELDLILTALRQTDPPLISSDLNEAAITFIAKLIDMQEKLKLNIEELCALFDQLPVSGDYPQPPKNEKDKMLFERIFDPKKIFGIDLTTGSINPSTSYHHYSLNEIDPDDKTIDPNTPLLLAGLGISETELLLLFDLLKDEIPFNSHGDCMLDRRAISLLYRHAKLAKALKLTIEDFILALNLNFAFSGNNDIVVRDLEQVFKLIDFKEWIRTTPFSVNELYFILNGEESGIVKFQSNLDSIAAMIQEIYASEEANKIEDSVRDKVIWTMVQEIQLSEETNKIGLLRNYLSKTRSLTSDQLMDALDWLEVDINKPGIQISLDATFTNGIPDNPSDLDALIELIVELDFALQLFQSILKYFNLTFNQLIDVLKWVVNDKAGLKISLDATFTNGIPDNPSDLDALIELTREMEQVLLVFSNLKFKEEPIHNITTRQQLLGIQDLKHLTLDDIKSLVTYKKHVTLEGAEPSIQLVMKSYADHNKSFTSNDIDILTDLWKKDRSLIESLVKSDLRLNFPIIPIEAIEYLWKCLEVSDTLGINGFSLVKLGEDNNYDNLLFAKDIVLGAFSSKYENEKIRIEKLEPYRDSINIIKRDILCNYIITRQADLKFKDLNDMYSYFLLDVEMGSCFRTSRLVCAISSLQLYVHRCLVNLERSIGGDIIVDPSRIPADEWEWRKNYRVWEANRKVFLYPENYLLPDLRDNKTPIFKELEQELLQEKITKESAEDSYTKYLSEFAELARLKISGSYYHNENGSSTYYFFGRTQQDPSQYYYRKWIDNKVWTHWEKIDLAIDSDQVSAIIYLGKLYLFWCSIISTSKTDASKIDNIRTTYNYSKQLMYSFLNEQEKWIAPQKLSFIRTGDMDQTVTLNKIIFPFKHDKIYVIGFDENLPILYFPLLSQISKLNLFRHTLEGNISNLPGLIPPNSDLIVTDHKSGTSEPNFYYVRLKTFRIPERIHEARFEETLSGIWSSGPWFPGIDLTNYLVKNVYHPELHVVGYRPGDFVFIYGDQQYLIQKQGIFHGHADDHIDPDEPVVDRSPFLSLSETTIPETLGTNNKYVLSKPDLWLLPPMSKRYTYRLSTSLADNLGEILFTKGLDGFLSLTTQRKKEEPVGINFLELSELTGPYDNADHVDFNGAYGIYYQEVFFHIPFLIANHLNTSQKFKEAKWWYERIFNPTAIEPDPTIIPLFPSDRAWQYIEFRNVTIQKMKDILTNQAAIETYEKDPFNPHAIARLRLNAYQKTIVMKYIDNLIDWGDQLFAQDTMESINEATMLYVLASDILGKRPVKIGTCEIAMSTKEVDTGDDVQGTECKAPLTYEKIEACSIDMGSDFLIELENWQYANMIESAINMYKIATERNALADSTIDTPDNPIGVNVNFAGGQTLSSYKPRHDMIHYSDAQRVRKQNEQIVSEWENTTNAVIKKLPSASMIVKPSMLAFCIPPNNDLLSYWDRVWDRLFKIHNCMNISGVRRQLALFQPPINPMTLVRAKAAGLTLEEIFMPSVEQIPHYRFSYLIEKATQFTQTVQNLGSSLLSALEKKDTEELVLLRSVHERNILNITKEIKDKQLTDAKAQYDAAIESRTNVQNRLDHYSNLIQNGLLGSERVQQDARNISGTGFNQTAKYLKYASALYMLGQFGSAFAITFGGKQLGAHMGNFAQTFSSAAQFSGAVSESAGMQANFERRSEEWEHQKLLADRELKQMDKQILASSFRVEIADKDIEIHNKNIEQTNELDEFYKSKFTKLGLYNYLCTSLTRLYREAYNLAFNMAKTAERAYGFETGDPMPFITNDNWQLDNAGLLAGERLLLQLQRMETAYIENNKRNYEITQTFSLAMLNPDALMKLRQIGRTEEFHIPEVAYELVYPGGYCRFIKSVAITVPCVMGPYANLSARLVIHSSKVRKDTDPDKVLDEFPEQDSVLIPLTERNNTSIMTSHGNKDSGTFELNFRDERYLPFEGAGAISTWSLDLPKAIRSFNYDTIPDVFVHITYTSKEDALMREKVEERFETELSDIASSVGLFRLISLKHEFPNSFHQLLNPPAGQPQKTEFDLEEKHFPYFISDKVLTISPSVKVKVYLKPILRDGEIDTSGLSLKVNNVPVGTWSSFRESNMQECEISIVGTPIRKWTIDAGSNGLIKEEVDDLLILLPYTTSS